MTFDILNLLVGKNLCSKLEIFCPGGVKAPSAAAAFMREKNVKTLENAGNTEFA
ncbi:MAG: hypothetical protein JKY68_07115 [Rhodospirillales bacterium]|nr:hypothetical protein [Rhodospirillales bacterium]